MSAAIVRFMDFSNDEDTWIEWESDVMESADDPADYAYGVVWTPSWLQFGD